MTSGSGTGYTLSQGTLKGESCALGRTVIMTIAVIVAVVIVMICRILVIIINTNIFIMILTVLPS